MKDRANDAHEGNHDDHITDGGANSGQAEERVHVIARFGDVNSRTAASPSDRL